jgi:cell division protein FtsB
MDRISKRNWLPVRQICIACIIIFTCSICFGVIGYVDRKLDIKKKEQNIEKLKKELRDMETQIVEKRDLKERLESDSLTIEAVARSYGFSKKGEKSFYFLD